MLGLMIATALAQGTPMPAPQWRSIERAPGGEVFVDTASLRRDRDTFEILVRIIFTGVQRSGMARGITRNRYFCATRTFLTLHVHYVDANGGTLEDRPARGAAARERPVTPGSPNEKILADYCPR
ncbi:MAG TPA: surface-adhesin E family protein [Allosphingosinicella sp.]|nr:surface-adhesin E family protein [Allosphingosinicella sp.]